MFGFSREELLGQDMVDWIVPQEFRDGHNAGMAHYRRTGEGPVLGKRIELSAIRKSGEEFPIELAISEVKQQSGTVFVAYVRDITDQKKAESKIQEAITRAEAANSAKSAFLANMSHEIRTPLNAMLGLTGILDETDLSAKQRDYVKTLQRSGRDLLYLINDILDVSKLEAGELQLESTVFSLRELAEAVIELFHPQAVAKKLTLTYRLEDNSCEWVRGDAGRVRQILHNFIGNAIKFTDAGGVILRINTRANDLDGVGVHLAVEDTGRGIKPNDLGRLFERFSQVDQADARRFSGAGLGLAITKGLAEVMGGTVDVSSTYGQGSTFEARVELHSCEAPSDETNAALNNVFVLVDLGDKFHEETIVGMLHAAGADVCIRRDVTGQTLPLASHDAAVLIADWNGVPRDIADSMDLFGDFSGHFRLAALRDAGDPAAATAENSDMFDIVMETPVRFRTLVAKIREGIGLDFNFGADLSENVDDAAEADSSKKLRVLVVDDNQTNQLVCSMMLESMGHYADVAGSGVDGISAVLTLDYDIVLMDIQMPGMDGIEATKQIRAQQKAGSAIPIVALTANVFPQTRQKCEEAGMNGFIEKPVSKSEIRDALSRYIQEPRNISTEESAAQPKPGAASDAPLIDLERLQELIDLIGLEKFQTVRSVFEGELQSLRTSFLTQNLSLDQEQRLAHRLKGICGDFCAARLRTLASELEQAATAGDSKEVIELRPAMLRTLDDTVAVVGDL